MSVTVAEPASVALRRLHEEATRDSTSVRERGLRLDARATVLAALPALADLVASVEECCATNCPEARHWRGVSIAACNCSHCTSLAALRERLGAKP